MDLNKHIYKTIGFITLFILGQLTLSAQNADDITVMRAKIIDNDTMPHMLLRQVVILPPLEFKDKKEYIKYTKLVHNIKKVYPYSREAARIFTEVHHAMDTIKNKRQRKKFVNAKDQELQDKYGDELKKLTITQGRLLIKLVDRETGFSSYEIIKELKGSFTAFMWQQLARMFGSNLKDEFDADGEDKYIDRIVIMIENGMI